MLLRRCAGHKPRNLVRVASEEQLLELGEHISFENYCKCLQSTGGHRRPCRTLEIYEQIGLAQKAIEQGTFAGRVRPLAGGEVRGELDLSNIGRGLSSYPFVLMLEQSKTRSFFMSICKTSKKRFCGKPNIKALRKPIRTYRCRS